MKKKQKNGDPEFYRGIRKGLLVMKCFFLFMFLSVLSSTASVYSQNKHINLKEEGITIKEVFKKIEEQSRFRFFYEVGKLNVLEKKDVNFQNNTIDEVLNHLFDKSEVDYRILENDFIILKVKPEVQQIYASQDQQNKGVSGKVTDSGGQPLPGVTVVVKGTTQGTVTNADGNYSLNNIPDDATLVFSFVGMQTQEAAVRGQTSINVVMEEDVIGIEEVIAIGYGTMKKSDLTGSVASVSSDKLEAFPTQDVEKALQGRAAGVQVTSISSAPGAEVKIRIRGNTSINAGNDPLYVVDGFAGASLPPAEDIESIEILKDASATAIYGSRGANGVILITTKKGKEGVTKIEFNGSYSVLKVGDTYDVLNATQYAQYQNTLRDAIDSPLPRYENPESLGKGTNWQDVIFRTGAIKNYQVAVSGGRKGINFYTSARYYGHDGSIINSQFEKFSGRTNLEIKFSDQFKCGARMDYAREIKDGIESQRSSGAGVLSSAFLFDPTMGIYDEEGNYTRTSIDFPLDNPYALAIEKTDEKLQNKFTGNIFLEYEPMKSLKFTSTWGANVLTYRQGIYYPRILIGGEAAQGSASVSTSQAINLITENYFTYNHTFNEIHKFNIIAGYSYQESNYEAFNTGSSEFVTDAFLYWNLSGGANYSIPGSGISEWNMASFYGRLNYNLKDRYLFTFTGRYDGSSRFGANNKWAFFPSGAFAWNVKEEPFLKSVEDLSHLKFRVSYGETGNAEIGSYNSLARLSTWPSTVGGTIVNAVRPISVANSDLSWESTAQYDVGVDAGFFNGKINFIADYYHMKTFDLLYNLPLPYYTGYTSSLQNSGIIQNKGFEFTINTMNLNKKLKWNTDFNISFNRNKVLELYGGEVIYSASPGHIRGGSTHILREGEPLGSFYGYIYEGVYQEGDDFSAEPDKEPGDEKFQDNNGRDENSELTGQPDGTVNDDDRTIMGNPNPDFIFGLTNDFSYKNFDLNIFIQGSYGNDMINYTRMELETMNGADNVSTAFLNAWTPENTDTDVPKVGDYSEVISTRWLENGSYLRVKNIALGYTIPKHITNAWKIDKFRLYISMQNILTLTKYSGLDPEVSWSHITTRFGGDYDSYPSVKTFTFGVNIVF
jgi:TonB-linked SusC/RagA family outer membrane protein